MKIRITFPKYAEYQNQLVLERWIPWVQVYGEKETDESSSTSTAKSP